MKGKKRKESSLGYSPPFKSQRGFMKLKLQLNHWMQLTNFLHLVHKRKQTKIKCAHTHQGVCTELADLIYSKAFGSHLEQASFFMKKIEVNIMM